MLLFIDNIFRFTQAGSEVSTLLGRMPRRWVTSRHWPTRWVSCRNASPRPRVVRSPRCRPSTCPPTTTPTRHPATTFAHLDATTELSRPISQLGIYPAVDPLDLDLAHPRPAIVGDEHYRVANEVKRILQKLQGAAGHHRHPRYGRTVRRGQGDGGSVRAASRSSSARTSWSPRSSPVRPVRSFRSPTPSKPSIVHLTKKGRVRSPARAGVLRRHRRGERRPQGRCRRGRFSLGHGRACDDPRGHGAVGR